MSRGWTATPVACSDVRLSNPDPAVRLVVFHHELVHHYQQRDGGVDTLALEREADQASIALLLGGLDEHDKCFVKRSLGVAIALSILTARGIHTGQHGGTTHPRAFDRLFVALDSYIHDPNHPAWAFTVAMLTIHLDNSNIKAPKGPYANHRDCVNGYIDAIANAGASIDPATES